MRAPSSDARELASASPEGRRVRQRGSTLIEMMLDDKKSLDAEARSRGRLRWGEAVRGPSAPRALLALVRMTEFSRCLLRSGRSDDVGIEVACEYPSPDVRGLASTL